MAHIETTAPSEAAGETREMYLRQQSSYGYVPNYAKVFSHRPEVMKLWSDLLYGVRRNMDKRRFELVTVSAAVAVRSSYCSLAHGRALTKYFEPREVLEIVRDADSDALTPAEKAMVKFARKIARDSSRVTAGDTDLLKAHGFSDAEIFDIAAVATARTFFAQLCEGLGAIADRPYLELDDDLREALTVGRPLDYTEPECVP